MLKTASNRIKNNSHISDLAVGKDTSSMKMSLGKAMNKKFLNKLMEHKAEKEMQKQKERDIELLKVAKSKKRLNTFLHRMTTTKF